MSTDWIEPLTEDDAGSLAELVQITSNYAREKLGETVWRTWATAQRANAELNIDASIA